MGRRRNNVLLRVVDLNVTFNKKHRTLEWKKKSTIKAVDNVSFELYESELLSVVGESGSGKTTIARCIMKLVDPNSGSIFYNDIDVTKLRAKSRRGYRLEVQMIFQDPFESLNPRQNVFTTISTPIYELRSERNLARIREEVFRLLEEVGLDPNEVIDRFPHQLSGGERQRVNIARALAPNPKLLIADEPVTMLDAEQRLNILSLLMELKSKRNLTILMITHDLATAKLTSDRTMVMYLGKLVEIGSTKVLLSRPHHPYVELMKLATPVVRRSKDMPEGIPIPFADETSPKENSCNFMPRCKYATSVCSTVEPKLVEKSKDHLAACHNPLNLGSEETS